MISLILGATQSAESGMLSAGWVVAYIAVAGFVGGILKWVYDRFVKKAEKHAQEPANELTAMGKTAEAVARASASLIGPFQEALRQNALDLGAQREAITTLQGQLTSHQEQLVDIRASEARCQQKLREFADQLGLDPNGD